MGWLRRLRHTVFEAGNDRTFDAEAELHLELRIDEYVRNGMSREDASLEARRRFGSATRFRDDTRDADMLPWLRDLAIDARYALRILGKSPWFAASAVLTLALAVGTNTAIFAVAYGVLIGPLSYPSAERLVRLSEEHAGARPALTEAVVSDLTFDAWERSTRTLEAMAAYRDRAYSITGRGDAERVRATDVSPSLFDVLQAAPAVGRFFAADDALDDTRIVLAFAYWQRAFGGSADAVGQTLTLDGRPRVIIGVAPEGFSFPDAGRQLYTPLVRSPAPPGGADRRVNVFTAIGRLARDVTPEQASAEGTSVARGLGPRPVAADLLFGQGGPVVVHARRVVDQMTAGVRPILQLLSVGVLLVLVLGCANVAGLCWSRSLTRERELAARRALGASRGRLVRQLLAESLVLAGGAAAVGLLVSWSLLQLWPIVAPRAFPRAADVAFTPGVSIYLLAASLVAGVLIGLAPVLHALRTSALASLRASGGGSASRRHARARQGLLALQTALAVVLLVGAALLARGFERLVTRDTGLDASRVTSARLSLEAVPGMSSRWKHLATEMLARVRALPHVEAAGAATMAPMGSSTHLAGFRLSGDRDEPVIARALGYVVTPGYAEALQLRVRDGRFLQDSDVGAATMAMVVNEQFVRTYFTDGAPVVGRRYTGLLAPGRVTEIVGVVGDVLRDGLTDVPQAEFYAVLGNHGGVTIGREIYLVIRSADGAPELASALRSIAHDVDPDIPVHGIRSLADEISASAGQSRFALAALGVFALLAAVLAALGLHAALTYAVSMRTRELGIRGALGASRRGLVMLVVRETGASTLLGIAIGLAAASMASRLVRSLLYGVDPLDALSFAAGPAIFALLGLAACAIPAWRAATLEPADVLRHE